MTLGTRSFFARSVVFIGDENVTRSSTLATPQAVVLHAHKPQLYNDLTLKMSIFVFKLNENIWEFRTLYEKKHYRLFAFWDKTDNKETLVLTTHGIIKKTKKTPKSEIKKAEEIRKFYFELKKQKK
ncbi:MAG: type II toxin-antitoxin system RelE/ParE family toxin [Bacteroidales bacterium]|nr:type II toxin-antitoxin system RelE/ParE family toxin [Bacteroidales bacterium]